MSWIYWGGGGGGSSVCSASPFTQVRRRALSEVRGPTFWKFLVAVGNLFSSGLLYRTTKMFPKKEDSLARYTQHCEILCGNFCSIRFCSRTFRNFWLNGRSHFGNSPFLDFLETFPENFQTICSRPGSFFPVAWHDGQRTQLGGTQTQRHF